ncbi:protein thtA [Aspergillus saccharolyticus JOP 1030-1]|uniref:Thermotolerance protein n=1 Tax=Aspergillus saccharolyticus JOP 1030-1 TaxID=1450539 RepID=A0A319A1M0_9EURO|nr:thermotolerance protein [Aspergillus saccharolyticus JOP 1030-1]PYH41402.1 thermotolerance protein [Aspergillus saccharolyticus JOP 1030-1]
MAQPRIDTGLPGNQSENVLSGDPMDIEADDIDAKSQTRVGLLSHTLVPSPIIQWILPARLRGRHQNDVVFVGERCLQIKEAVSGTHLEEVTVKHDLDSYIMAAKVINVSTELPWEAQMRLGDSRSAMSADTDLYQDLPPQILVLSLSSRELTFLYYWNAGDQFIYHHRPLPNDVSAFEKFGRNIAVEPRSRVVAVSASCDYFGIFVLKDPAVLQSQMAQNRLDPIAEERFFRVEGDIIAMEFLYPTPEDGDRIILLLLIAQDQVTHAVCYEWNAYDSLRQVTPKVTKKVLPLEDRLPTMLIPLTKTSSFVLVTTTSMVIYQDKLDPRRQPTRYPLPVPDRESQRQPLWTRWARPLRNWLYNQKHDDIYLCREDGRVFYLSVGNEGEVENQTHLGQLCCDVDAAFDILDIGYEGGDLLLAAGTTGDGGLFVQKARDHPRCVQRFMNWTPVTDSVIVRDDNASNSGVPGDRFFVCSASSYARGAVVELRHGIEAQSGLVVSLEELSSTADIWIMSDSMNGGIFILTTDPVSTVLLYLAADYMEEISAIDEKESGLDYGTQTLAAGCTDTGAIIQVTDKAIHIGATSDLWSCYRHEYGPEHHIVVAAVNGSSLLVAAAVRTSHEVHLHLKRLNFGSGQAQLQDVGPALLICYSPVCMSIETLDLCTYVFIGTGNGKILVYRVTDTVSLMSEITIKVEGPDDISKAIDSLAMITTTGSGLSNHYTLLCGLRSGILIPFEVMIDSETGLSLDAFKQLEPQRLGHTSVKVQSRGDIALLTCGHGFWQVSCSRESVTASYLTQRVWITDQNNPAYHPSTINSFCIAAVGGPGAETLSDTLFCVADGQLMICTLDQKPKTVPRRIDLPGSASKLMYSRHLRSLIVAYNQTAYDTDTDPIKRYTRSYIEFVDPDSQSSMATTPDNPTTSDSSRPWRPQSAAGEKISCILEWTPRKDGEEYHFIVIGTSRRKQQERGRVIFLQTYRDPNNPSHIECNVKHIHKFENPVFSIVPYGDFTLMVSTGHTIVPLEPKLSHNQGIRTARYNVHSPAILMTAREPYLYLTTSRESLVILKAGEDKLTLHAQDRLKHDGLSHVHLDGYSNLILTSSRAGRVSILTEDGLDERDTTMSSALCEAHLPSSVIRLGTGARRSPLSSQSQVIYGTAMNGTIYRFLPINEKEWRLLRLLQNLCIRDPILCPFTPRRQRQRNPTNLVDQPTQMHIDGDCLSRLLTRGTQDLLRLLNSEEINGQAHHSAQMIWERFLEFTRDVLGETSSPAESAIGWLRRVLQVEF